MIAERLRGRRGFAVEGGGERLSAVERFKFGEFLTMRVYQLADAPDPFCAFGGGKASPCAGVEAAPGRVNRCVDVIR